MEFFLFQNGASVMVSRFALDSRILPKENGCDRKISMVVTRNWKSARFGGIGHADCLVSPFYFIPKTASSNRRRTDRLLDLPTQNSGTRHDHEQLTPFAKKVFSKSWCLMVAALYGICRRNSNGETNREKGLHFIIIILNCRE